MLELSPLRLVVGDVDGLLILNHEIKPRDTVVRVAGKFGGIDIAKIEEREAVVAESVAVVKQARVELAEKLPAEHELLLTVGKIVVAVGSDDEHGVDIAAEEADTIAEGLLRGGVVDHDEILVLLETLHDAVDGIWTGAEAGMELVLKGETVGLGEPGEVVEGGEESLKHENMRILKDGNIISLAGPLQSLLSRGEMEDDKYWAVAAIGQLWGTCVGNPQLRVPWHQAL